MHVTANERVQSRKRLVHQQNGRVVGQSPGQAHALLHAARKLIRKMCFIAFEAHALDPAQRLGLAWSFALTLNAQTVFHVFLHRQMREQRKLLEDHGRLLAPKSAQHTRTHFQHILLANPDLARCGLDQAVDVPDQRALARTGQTHDDLNLARCNAQAHIPQAQNMAMHIAQLVFAHTLLDKGHAFVGCWTKDFVEVPDFNAQRFSHATSPCAFASAGHRPATRGQTRWRSPQWPNH